MKKTLFMSLLMAMLGTGCSSTEQFTLDCEERVGLADSDVYLHEVIITDGDETKKNILSIEMNKPEYFMATETRAYVSKITPDKNGDPVAERSEVETGIIYSVLISNESGRPEIECSLDYSKLEEMNQLPGSKLEMPEVQGHHASMGSHINTGYAEFFMRDMTEDNHSPSNNDGNESSGHKMALRYKTCPF